MRVWLGQGFVFFCFFFFLVVGGVGLSS
uniref:Uncharacterized protein n=1 Tax=Anguilla anguilla TaxID=7936 RepID=A0A0E9QA50_ANGAN